MVGNQEEQARQVRLQEKSERAAAAFETTLGKWTAAVKHARKELKLTGFVAIKKGTPLFSTTMNFYLDDLLRDRGCSCGEVTCAACAGA